MFTLQPSPQFGAYLPNRVGFQMPPSPSWRREHKPRLLASQPRGHLRERAALPQGKAANPRTRSEPPLEPLDCKVTQDVGGEGNYFKCNTFLMKGQEAEEGWGESRVQSCLCLSGLLLSGIRLSSSPAGKSLLGIKSGPRHKILII